MPIALSSCAMCATPATSKSAAAPLPLRFNVTSKSSANNPLTPKFAPPLHTPSAPSAPKPSAPRLTLTWLLPTTLIASTPNFVRSFKLLLRCVPSAECTVSTFNVIASLPAKSNPALIKLEAWVWLMLRLTSAAPPMSRTECICVASKVFKLLVLNKLFNSLSKPAFTVPACSSNTLMVMLSMCALSCKAVAYTPVTSFTCVLLSVNVTSASVLKTGRPDVLSSPEPSSTLTCSPAPPETATAFTPNFCSSLRLVVANLAVSAWVMRTSPTILPSKAF